MSGERDAGKTANSQDPSPLFTFAIVSDTHIRPPGGDESSPFPVNLRANARARHAIREIARHAPSFTIHLGDMVHPMPSLPTFAPAAEEAKRIFAPLAADLHFVPGNHDVGDKPLKGLPAEFASEHSLRIYQDQFGPSWHAFDRHGCRFVVVNSSLINRGIEAETRQWAWLERELPGGGTGKRTFVFIHYPPFITTPDEPSHYDNLDEPGRGRLIGMLQRAGVEAVFSGHVHHFFFNRLGPAKLYVLPPTSFTRQDYAELFPVSPADEFGRDDRGKYGWALVDVLPGGHRVRIVPTDGVERAADEADAGSAPGIGRAERAAPRGGKLVAHLRHAWATPITLPYNGPMEEFSRKRARNDALLMRLWQMGVTRLRTPLSDLLEPETRRRIEDFHAAGMSFTFFTLTVPDAAATAALAAARQFTDALQVVTANADLSDIRAELSSWAAPDGLRVTVGKLHSSADEPRHGSHFAHAVSFGFKNYEQEPALAAVCALRSRSRIDGVAFQINLSDDLIGRLNELNALGAAEQLCITANVRLAHENPAVANFDDMAIAERLRTAVTMADHLEHVTVEIDTLIDLDRGYNPRHGLLDRRCNLRRSGRWLAGFEG
jgi:3',5'-cyclic AMP phosphodiesterase CpdA